ncbi:MAG: PrsW family intramembrane metalloprotease [Lachnospiraceae bacterium]|nr:PrsW family intramembrane metalloprotease [Lachnospiraceae bacterium]
MIYAENILVCIAIPLMISLLFIRGSARMFVAGSLIGMGVCLLAGYFNGFISYTGAMSETDTSVFVAPLIEEIMKFVPLLMGITILRLENRELLIFAAGIGTGFATFENCCHILTSGADSFGYVLIRGMSVGVMHIVSLLTVAFGTIVVRRFRVLHLAGIMGALAFSMTVHGLYNLLVSQPGITSFIGYAFPVVMSAVLYYIYKNTDFGEGEKETEIGPGTAEEM